MTLYTSYWAQVRNIPSDLICLNTTVFPPKWRSLGKDKRDVWVIDCPPLKPGPTCTGLCQGICNPKHPADCTFLREYRKQLDKINVDNFLDKLFTLRMQMAEGENKVFRGFIFLVFEAPKNPCSERIVLHQWLNDNGIKVEEWNPNI